ncbi:MAG: glutaredoxin family protein [Gammaproteobacteria bacterium]|nr:glutaredoxin family protein [Gammaproteobacteria bacterium]
MVNDVSIVLYSTDHCTLCDRALDLLLSMPELQGRSLEVVDVAADDALLDRYGERLPVLRFGVRELSWPFSAQDVSAMLG